MTPDPAAKEVFQKLLANIEQVIRGQSPALRKVLPGCGIVNRHAIERFVAVDEIIPAIAVEVGDGQGDILLDTAIRLKRAVAVAQQR